jgi:HemY protein
MERRSDRRPPTVRDDAPHPFDRQTGTPPMIRILVYFAVVFAVAIGAAWLADRPGTVSIDWQGWRLDTSVMVAAVALLALLAATLVVWAFLRGLFRAPLVFRRYLGRRREDKGHMALSRGLVAVGAGDARLARRYMTEARRLLPRDPATRFLEAQTAQLTGDSPAARAAFEAMLDDPETRALGLHGLYVEAVRAGEPAAAFHYAEEAVAIAPGLPWAGRARFEHAAAVRDWEGAIAILDKNAHNALVDKPTAKRMKAVLLTARALELEAAAPERARALALEAHGLASDLVPAAGVAGRLLARLNDPRRATKVIEATWRRAPHPELAEAYVLIRPGETGRDRLKRMRGLAALKPGDVEGRLAVARAAIDAREFEAARLELRAVFAERPSQRACLLMADLEEAEHGDRGRVREWLSRAVRAPRDPVWTADGVTSEHWAPVSPASGRLDAFEWKVPIEAIGSTAGPLIDEALFAPPEPAPPEPEPPLFAAAVPVPPAAAASVTSATRGASTSGPSGSAPAIREPASSAAVSVAAASPVTSPAPAPAATPTPAPAPLATTEAVAPATAATPPSKPFWARAHGGPVAAARDDATTAPETGAASAGPAGPGSAGATGAAPSATPAGAAPSAWPAAAVVLTAGASAAGRTAGASGSGASGSGAGAAANGVAAAAAPSASREVLVMPSSLAPAPAPEAAKPYWARDREPGPIAPAAPAGSAASAGPAASGDARRGPKLVEFPLAHSPDDPGPTTTEDDAATPRPRLRLF